MAEATPDKRQGATDWDAVRAEYEGRLFHPATICRRHGITAAQLRYRRERGGWLAINARPPRQDDIVRRMLAILARQVKQLEKAMDEPIDKQTRTLAEQVKTLDKLIELGATERNAEPPTRQDMTGLRAKLVRRLEQAAR